jgi:hypothetical protein
MLLGTKLKKLNFMVNFHKLQTTNSVEASVSIFGFRRTKDSGHQYATAADFCRIFENNMNRLYLLSLLLTGDHETAERCFVGGLEDSKNSNPVFREWAQSWARRAIIINAILALAPRPLRKPGVAVSDEARLGLQNMPAELAAIGGLETFERFVFVISVLEGYSDRECSLLLNCSSSEIAAARLRAVQQLGNSVAADHELVNITDAQPLSTNPAVPATPDTISQFAATA